MSKTLPRIFIRTDYQSPEQRYAFDLVLCRILGLTWNYANAGSDEKKDFVLEYSSNPESNKLLWDSGFLNAIPDFNFRPEVRKGEVPKLFPCPDAEEAFDLFAGAFFMAALFAFYSPEKTDAHGRMEEESSFLFVNDLVNEPLVHRYALLLKNELHRFGYPDFELSQVFDYEVTVDIDNPWKYLHKGWKIQLGGWIRDLIKGNFALVIQRLSILASGKDPFHTFLWMEENLPPGRTRLFFLCGHHSPYDTRYHIGMPEYRKLIMGVVKGGIWKTGLHPSYTTTDKAEKIRDEKNQLAEITGSVNHSRQHFLRYRIPETFRALIASGIKNEYSLCPRTRPGFLGGMALPFPWFDIGRREETSLLMHPCMVMDRGLQRYSDTEAKDVAAVMIAVAEKTKSYGGKFIVILHNETFSEFGEWKGWREPMLKVINKLEVLRTDGSGTGPK